MESHTQKCLSQAVMTRQCRDHRSLSLAVCVCLCACLCVCVCVCRLSTAVIEFYLSKKLWHYCIRGWIRCLASQTEREGESNCSWGQWRHQRIWPIRALLSMSGCSMESCCAVRVAAVKHVLHMKDKSAREERVDTEVCLVTVLAAPRRVEFGS